MTFRHPNTASENHLRIVTYNIHKGVQGIGPLSRLEIHNLRDAIEQFNADIVCLQEVRHFNTLQAKRFKHWPQSSQSEFLAPAGYYTAYKTNAVTQHGEHGNAVLSRWPILRHQHEDMSDHRLEQRGLLHVVIDYKNTPIHVVVLHLGLFANSRKRQIAQLSRYLEREIGPSEALIVAGDFNDWSNALSPLILEMGLSLNSLSNKEKSSAEQDLGDMRKGATQKIPTFPSRLPLLQLDYVYSRGLSALTSFTPAGKQWARLSDHLPLIVEYDEKIRH